MVLLCIASLELHTVCNLFLGFDINLYRLVHCSRRRALRSQQHQILQKFSVLLSIPLLAMELWEVVCGPDQSVNHTE